MASGSTLCKWVAEQGSVGAVSGDAIPDINNEQYVLDFADSNNKEARFRDVMPSAYDGGGVTIKIHGQMSSATTGDVDLRVSLERQTSLDVDTDSFGATTQVIDTTVPATAGERFVISINVSDGTNMDSVVAGDGFRLKVERHGGTASGDYELAMIEMVEQ